MYFLVLAVVFGLAVRGQGTTQWCFPSEQLGPHDGGWGGAPVPSSLLSKCEIARVSADMPASEFKRRFVDPQLPALITAAAVDWPMSHLFKLRTMSGRWPTSQFRIGQHAQGVEQFEYATIPSFIEYLAAKSRLDATASEGANLTAARWMMWDDITLNEQADALRASHPVSSRLDPRQLKGLSRPGVQFAEALVLGGPCSGSHTHSHGRSYAALAYGLKHWAFVDSNLSAAAAVGACPECIHGPSAFFQRFVQPNGTRQFAGHRVLECVQKAGDVMFVPQKWHHTVLNLWASVAIVTELNDETSDDFFKTEEDQQSEKEGQEMDSEEEDLLDEITYRRELKQRLTEKEGDEI